MERDTGLDETVDPEPIHGWFSLSYASWLVLPRVVMEAMPQDWQSRMVVLLRELDRTYDWVPEGKTINVHFREKDGTVSPMPHEFANYRRPDRAWLESIRTDRFPDSEKEGG